jgi:hypothetical protein
MYKPPWSLARLSEFSFLTFKYTVNVLLAVRRNTSVVWWVHTCNVTAYRNAVTLQVTETIQIYDLNFHAVPHGVTVSCERYTVGFPVCYASQLKGKAILLQALTRP